MSEDRIEMYKVSVDMYKMEKDQYWTRSNVFLVIQSALLVAFSSERAAGDLGLFVCAVGMVLSSAWLAISIHSEYYIKRWREIVRTIEVDLSPTPFLLFPKDSTRFGGTVTRGVIHYLTWPVNFVRAGGPSRMMNVVICVITIMWLVLALFEVFPRNTFKNLIFGANTACFGGLIDSRFCEVIKIVTTTEQ